MTTIGVGIIGCGKVVQAVHLPSLMQLADTLRVAAVCDASETVARRVAERWAVPHWATDIAQLLARPDVDAVLVANPNRFHAATTEAALAAGKHVLLEKPAAMSLAELDRLIAAERAAARIVQVGYMRRYAPGYHAAREALGSIGEIRAARVHDLIDAGLPLLATTADVIRDARADAAALNLDQDDSAILGAAIGEAPAPIRNAYQLLLRLGCHDLSILRGLIGAPHGVLHAAQRWNGAYLAATFDYGAFLCQFDVGLNIVAGTDIRTEIVGARGTLTLTYDMPYVRHLPARLTTTRVDARGDVVVQTHDSQGKDQFALEWADFHATVTGRRRPENSLDDARADLEIAVAVVAALRAGERG